MFDFLMLLSAIVMLSLDFVYLSVMKGYFMNQVKNVQGSALKLNYFGAALCYVFLIAGLNYFIIKPRKSVSDAFLLGLVIYGVYETTNYALLSNWSIITVIIDTLWGGLLFASTAYVVEKLRYIF
jgi:uncharacterized membrane protein